MNSDVFKKAEYEFESEEGVASRILDTLLDTGSPISFIKRSIVPAGSIHPYEGCDYNGINGSALIFVSVITVFVTLDEIKRQIKLLVVPNETMISSVVLGRDALWAFNLRLKALSEIEASAITEIVNIETSSNNICDSLEINPEIDDLTQLRLKKMFLTNYVNRERPDSPRIKIELGLRLTDERPIYFNPRRLSFEEKEHLVKIIDDLLFRGIIRESELPYASPIVLTKKKNSEFRLCADYRFLNKVTLRDNYPLPLIEDQFDKLQGKKYFSLLDLKDGFHNMDMEADSIKYMAVITPIGQFEYMKAPYRLKTAPARFQRFINKIFENLIKTEEVAVYLDDILVISETLEHHFEILKKVLNLLVENKLELRIDKCKFFQTALEYLGYRISVSGVSPTSHGIEAVVNFPSHKTFERFRAFWVCVPISENLSRVFP